MLEVLSKHFAVLSAITLAVASTVTMLFFAVYLSVFDWGLIWLIEYADLAKFFLLAAAAGSSTVLLLLQFSPQIPQLLNKNTPFRWVFIGIFVVLVIGGPAHDALSELSFNAAAVTLSPFKLSKLFCYIMTFIFAFMAIHSLEEIRKRNIERISYIVSIMLVCVGLYGLTWGLRVRSEPTQQRIVTTKSEAINDARIIMMLSHHTALYVGEKVIVLPTAEITRIESKAAPL